MQKHIIFFTKSHGVPPTLSHSRGYTYIYTLYRFFGSSNADNSHRTDIGLLYTYVHAYIQSWQLQYTEIFFHHWTVLRLISPELTAPELILIYRKDGSCADKNLELWLKVQWFFWKPNVHLADGSKTVKSW
jgi:hypothetical protein